MSVEEDGGAYTVSIKVAMKGSGKEEVKDGIREITKPSAKEWDGGGGAIKRPTTQGEKKIKKNFQRPPPKKEGNRRKEKKYRQESSPKCGKSTNVACPPRRSPVAEGAK